MFNLIPNDMREVAEKLAYEQAHDHPNFTEKDVLIETAKAGVQEMFDEALEGPYYNVRWQGIDSSLLVTGPLKEEIITMRPRIDFATFSADFKNNPILFWRNISQQIKQAIKLQ